MLTSDSTCFLLFWTTPQNQSFERETLQKDGILHINKKLQLRQLTKSIHNDRLEQTGKINQQNPNLCSAVIVLSETHDHFRDGYFTCK